MQVIVPSEVDLPEESDSAFLTRKGLKTLVLTAVGDEVGRLTKRLSTERTAVRLLSRVCISVLLHVGFLVEFLSTEFALERARVRVNQHVRG